MARKKAATRAKARPLDRQLLKALDAGDETAARAALAEGADPNARQGKRSALELAGRNDALRCALIDAGAWDRSLTGSLPWAVTTGRAAIVQTLIERGAELDACAPIGTAVQVAARAGELDILRVLLAAGASPEAGNSLMTPLLAAVDRGQGEAAALLLEAGADPDKTPYPTMPRALALAVLRDQGNIARALIAAGAEVDIAVGELALAEDMSASDPAALLEDPALLERLMNPERAVECPALVLAARLGRAAIVEDLLEAGADPAARDGEGRTALAWARERDQTAVIAVLEARGAERGAAPLDALLAAAEAGDLTAIAASLAAGAEVDGRDERRATRGWTALMHAAAGGRAGAASALIAAGAAVEARASEEPAPQLKSLFSHGGLEALEMAGVEPGRSALHKAAESGSAETLAVLLAAGADAARADFLGYDALMIAAQAGHAALIAPLILAGADPKARGPGRQSALMLAAERGRLAELRALAEAGAKLDLKDASGLTPLMHAAQRCDIAMVRELLARAPGAAKTKSKAHGGVLHQAASAMSSKTLGIMKTSEPCPEDEVLELVALLLEAGADPKARNREGETAADLARLFGHKRAARALEKG